MTTIANVEQLKTTLETYLQQVQQGKTILIMEKGRELALLTPLTQTRQALQKLADEGLARLSSGERWRGASIQIDLRHASVAQAIIDARENQ